VNVEVRKIKKLVKKLPLDIAGKRPVDPLPDVPAEKSRRGAITTQKAAPVKVHQEHVYALTKPRAVEGYVTLTQLAGERGIQAQLARIWVLRANIKKPADGWRWLVGSKGLANVRKVLELDT
jgi:hypothetical protein